MQKLWDIARTLSVTDYLSYRDYLARVYGLAKSAYVEYSYQKFAEDLGFSATNVLRLIIKGARPLTSKAAVRIALSLKLSGAERRYWTTLVKYANARLPDERSKLFRLLLTYKTRRSPNELSPEQVAFFNDWSNPVVREVALLPDFDGSPEWIKSRITFPLRLEQIKQSLDLLVKLGMMSFDSHLNQYRPIRGQVETPAEVDSLAIVSFHQRMIEISREAITQIDEAERDVRALTMSVPSKKIPELKARIEEWIYEMSRLEHDGDSGGDEARVVQINVQMFPLSKKARRGL